MSRGPISIFENPTQQPPQASLASWYLPGLSDGLGDRLLMFDNTGSASLELLRFKREFSEKLAFEPALRQRIRQLETFTHPSVGRIRALKWLPDDDGLALVSDHIAGRRLSEVLRDAHGPGFALELIRQLTPALVALQQHGDGVAHGVLTPERIVVTPEGRLVLVEHVLGSAVDALDLPPTRLRNELGLALPGGEAHAPRNGRGDVVQLGLIALSLVLGRRVDARAYPHHVSTLLDEFPRIAGRGASSSPPLRMWLEQALQLGGRTFGSAEDAHAALADVTDGPTPRPDPRRMLFFRPIETPHLVPGLDPAIVPRTDHPPERHSDMPAKWPNPKERADGSQPVFEQVIGRNVPEKAPDEKSVGPFEIGGHLWPLTPAQKQELESTPPQKRFHVRWLTATLALIALGEGLFIAGLLYGRPSGAVGAAVASGSGAVMIESTQPGVEVLVDGQPVGATPFKLDVGSGTRSIRVLAAGSGIASSLPGTTTVRPSDTKPIVPPPANSSLGGLRVASAIDLQVFEEGKLIGTTAGAMAVPAGRHTVDVVNDKFGYRSRQTIDVRSGQTATLSITLPNGRISINAVPWAEVWIGGNLVGDTPLANLSLPLGEHEIVFKHPQLGERKQTALVRSDVMTRVTANLQR